MIITPIKTRIFREGEDLISFIREHIEKIEENDILVVTSKIVALAEGRTALNTGLGDKERLIKEESEFALETPLAWLTIKDGTILASAGIDESNADGKFILLPRNSFESAWQIRKHIKEKYGLRKCGVLITDSRLLPLRAGVVGIAVGYAGFEGIRDYRGMPDLFGRPLTISRTDVADSVATAAVLEMGEGDECIPLALVSRARVVFTDQKPDPNELKIDPKNDIYRPLFEHMNDLSE